MQTLHEPATRMQSLKYEFKMLTPNSNTTLSFEREKSLLIQSFAINRGILASHPCDLAKLNQFREFKAKMKNSFRWKIGSDLKMDFSFGNFTHSPSLRNGNLETRTQIPKDKNTLDICVVSEQEDKNKSDRNQKPNGEAQIAPQLVSGSPSSLGVCPEQEKSTGIAQSESVTCRDLQDIGCFQTHTATAAPIPPIPIPPTPIPPTPILPIQVPPRSQSPSKSKTLGSKKGSPTQKRRHSTELKEAQELQLERQDISRWNCNDTKHFAFSSAPTNFSSLIAKTREVTGVPVGQLAEKNTSLPMWLQRNIDGEVTAVELLSGGLNPVATIQTRIPRHWILNVADREKLSEVERNEIITSQVNFVQATTGEIYIVGFDLARALGINGRIRSKRKSVIDVTKRMKVRRERKDGFSFTASRIVLTKDGAENLCKQCVNFELGLQLWSFIKPYF